MWDDDSEDEEERANTGRANNPRTMSRTREGKKCRDKMLDDESEDEEERESTGRENNQQTMSCTRGGKKRSDEMSDNESEDKEERANNPRMIEWLQERCLQLQSTVKSLQREIRVLKSNDRKTKRQLRIIMIGMGRRQTCRIKCRIG